MFRDPATQKVTQICLCFSFSGKEFDSVPRDQVLRYLEEQGVNWAALNSISPMFDVMETGDWNYLL